MAANARAYLSLLLSALIGISLPSLAAEPVNLTVGYQPYDTISYSAAVIRALELWKKYLPAGSQVEFQGALQGSIIVNNMLAGKQQIGYLGDMPAVVSTTKANIAPIELVANLGLSAGQRCNVVMVRADAPQFKSPKDAVQWLNGKVIATPRGSCADRFLRTVIAKAKIQPKEILNQSLEVIATSFRAKKIDAAVLWEPTVSRIGNFVGEGIAREVATGYNFDSPDAGFIAMREDFVKQHPEIAKDWLKAEIEAQQYVLNPANWDKVAAIVKGQTTGISPAMAWFSLYGKVPPKDGGSPLRDTKPFVFTNDVNSLLDGAYKFLYEVQVISVSAPPPGALNDSLAREVAKEVGVALPLGQIKPEDASKAPRTN
jgi:sulfonate transport system substrate-binding protein